MDFQDLQESINTGMAWKLEGSYGRAAMHALETGDCMLGHEGCFDYYGNYIPSRYEVAPGTKGSPENAGIELDRSDEPTYRVRFHDGSLHDVEAPQLFGAFANKHLARFAPVEILETV